MKHRAVRPLSGIVSVLVVTLLSIWPLEHAGATDAETLRPGIRERGAPLAREADLRGQTTKPGDCPTLTAAFPPYDRAQMTMLSVRLTDALFALFHPRTAFALPVNAWQLDRI